ncbi:MAG: hypothetical protein DRJ59_08050 [Thermoprotei archaeon]|nr:MAG: hypothetical protein DRJ59_08050 [Thermoprotei archaeon]
MRRFNDRIALSISCLVNRDLFTALDKAKELGFQSIMAMPYNGRAYHSVGRFATLDFYSLGEDKVSVFLEKLGEFKHISLHQAWDNEWKKWIDCAAEIGAEIVTVHAMNGKLSLKNYFTERVRHLQEIGDYAQERGLRIGVENDGGSFRNYIRLIKEVDHPAVGATLDLGHCAYFSEVMEVKDLRGRVKLLNEVIGEMVLELDYKVYNLHVHNVNASWRDHRSVPDGVIDVRKVIQMLERTGYRGLYVIELEEADCVKRSLESGAYIDDILQLFKR